MRTIDVADGRVMLPGLTLSAQFLHHNHFTHMVGNMCHRPIPILVVGRGHVGKVALIDLDVGVECCTKSHNLHIISVRPPFGHLLQMSLKGSIDLLFRGRSSVDGSGESSGILPLGVASDASTRVNVDEVFVNISVLPQIFDHASPDLVVTGLGAVDLIGESVEETVACSAP